jgi:hypothetical protein
VRRVSPSAQHVVTALTSVGALIGLIWTIHQMVGPPWPSSPDIRPSANPSSPYFIPPFLISNGSAFFDMWEVRPSCLIREAVLTNRDGQFASTFGPLSGSRTIGRPLTIGAGETVNFHCDAVSGIRNVTVGDDGAQVTLDKLKSMSVVVDVSYQTNMLVRWNRIRRKAFSWIDAPQGPLWVEGEVIQ